MSSLAADRNRETIRPRKTGSRTPVAIKHAGDSSETAATVDSTRPPSVQATMSQVMWQVIASAGGLRVLGDMTVGSTVGQTVAGQSSMGEYVLNSGFQQDFEGGDCCIPPVRGDVNYDWAELIDISDLLYLIDYMFRGGPLPACHEEADINADGAELIDIADLVYLIDYMFRGGPAPPACP
jgi:hypothetical protein